MYFNNINLIRFNPATMADKLAHLDAVLAKHPLRALAPMELSNRGWVSPFGIGETALTHTVNGCTLLALGGLDKLLPSSAINLALHERIAAVTELRGKPPGGRERRKLRDEVITELLPRALARPTRTYGYVDTRNGWLVINTASRRVAETFASKLREALGSFPCMHAEAQESPRAVMTAWLINPKELPTGWALGDACHLKDPADHGSSVRCTDQDLETDEITAHLSSGKQVTRLSVIWRDRLSFTLDENLILRQFKLLDIATEALENSDQPSAKAEIDARFALMTHELAPLLVDLAQQFAVCEVGA